MSDFTGMGGALTVCVIAQSIVFIALAIMAGVIYMVGMVAGEKDSSSQPVPAPLPAAQSEHPDDEEEIAAIVMAALAEELNNRDTMVGPSPYSISNWRIVSLQEAAQRGSLK